MLLLAGAAGALAVAVTVRTGGSAHSHTGHAGAGRVPRSDLWELWAVPPVEVVAIAALGVVVVERIDRTRADRRTWLLLASGLAVLVLSVCSPLGGLAQGGLLAAHMLQHTLIGGVAPLLVLLALPRVRPSGAVVERRSTWSRLVNPLVTLPLWVASTLIWLLPAVHHQVLSRQWLWIAQQVSFFVVGALLWAPVTERVPTPSWFRTGWKAAYMLGVFWTGLIIANVYWFSGTPFYPDHAGAARRWGLSPLQDQANAGTIMMLSHCLLAFGAIGVLFFRQAREDGLQQRLIEAGLDPAVVRRAVRNGDAGDLARQAGVPLRERAGID